MITAYTQQIIWPSLSMMQALEFLAASCMAVDAEPSLGSAAWNPRSPKGELGQKEHLLELERCGGDSLTVDCNVGGVVQAEPSQVLH